MILHIAEYTLFDQEMHISSGKYMASAETCSDNYYMTMYFLPKMCIFGQLKCNPENDRYELLKECSLVVFSILLGYIRRSYITL